MECEICGGLAEDPKFRAGWFCLRCFDEWKKRITANPYLERFHWSKFMPAPPQAPVEITGAGTVNLSIPSGESTAEADTIPVEVISAAYALRAQGKSVSVRAACKKAGHDRKHFTDAYPEAVKTVEMIAAPDRQPIRGRKVNGNLEAYKEDD